MIFYMDVHGIHRAPIHFPKGHLLDSVSKNGLHESGGQAQNSWRWRCYFMGFMQRISIRHQVHC